MLPMVGPPSQAQGNVLADISVFGEEAASL